MSYGMGSPLAKGPAFPKKLGGNPVASYPNFTPQQMQLHESLFSNVSPESFTGRLSQGDEDLFRQIEMPAERQFAERIGGIASRFSQGGGQGSLSGRRSGGFQRETSSAAQRFQEALQAQRLGLQQNAIKELMNMSNQLLSQRPYENYTVEPKRKWYESLIGGALPIAGAAGGGYLGSLYGDPIGGAQIGAGVGRGAAQGFFG
jgi:hypothetical protein